MKKIIFILLAVLISSCFKKNEESSKKVFLSEERLALIPYQKGEQIEFKDENGNIFNLSVVKDSIYWTKRKYSAGFYGAYYVSYQNKLTTLKAPNQDIEINIELPPTEDGLLINGYFLYHTTDGQFFPTYPDYQINGNTYNDVCKVFSDYRTDSDTIYYNKEFGVLKYVKFSGENYSIN